MRILITGCSGYIGSCLSSYYRKNRNTFFLDKIIPKNFMRIKNRFFKCDLNNIKKLEKIIFKIKPNIIIHLAAKSTVNEKIKKNNYTLNNIAATKNLLKVMNKHNVTKIIFASTAAVYDKSKILLRENSPLKPISNYGKSKLLAEKEIIKNNEVNYVILRFFNVSGCVERPLVGEFHNPETHLIPVSVFKALNNKVINIFGKNYKTKDGTCIRDYIHIKDICSAIIKSTNFIKKNNSAILNIGSGKGTSNNQVLSSLKKITKSFIKISYLKDRTGDQPYLVCNIDKAKKLLKWKPKYSIIKKILIDEIKWSKFLINKKIQRKYLSVQK